MAAARGAIRSPARVDQREVVSLAFMGLTACPVASRVVFCVFLLVPFAIAGFFALFYPLAWLTFFVLLLVLPACLIVATAKTAKELILALKLTSMAALLYGIMLGLAFAL